MVNIVGIAGSLRRHSYNAGLLRAAQQVMPPIARLEIASIAGIPLYDGDLEEAEGIPPAAAALKDAIAAADGLLIVTPEYNNGIPGVFKNAIDWASRPPADIARVFAGKRVAMIGASLGGYGSILAQDHWLPVLRAIKTRLWTDERLMVAGAGKAFDTEGNLVDEAVRTRLRGFMAAFVTSLRDDDAG